MATKSISQLTTAADVDNNDLFEVAHPDVGSATGYTSNKQSLAAIADHIAGEVNYPSLATTAKTLIAALEEVLNNFAPTYDNTETYSEGDIVVYAGGLYQSNTDIDTPEDFDSSKWDFVYASQVGGGGGGGSVDYSGTEHEIGTWFGQTLYAKTIKYTSPNNTVDSDTVIDTDIKHSVNCRVVGFEGVEGFGYAGSDYAMNNTTSPEPLGQSYMHLPWYGGATTNNPMIYCYSDGIHFMKNGSSSGAKSVVLTIKYIKLATM